MIEVQALSKLFGARLAVDQLSFNVTPGEILGFLGPNGAGKSTTMKMITGFLRPTSGTARINGFDIQTHAVEAKREFGYLPEGAPGYGDMTVLQYLKFIADVRGLRGAQRKGRIDAAVDDVNLSDVLAQKLDTLSKGFRRRVGLAQAILHDPKVLIMDEPTDGLDPNQKREVRKLIMGMSEDKIIVVSTHILEEVEAVCTRAMIIAHGRLLVDGTPEELAARSRYHGAVTLDLVSADDVSGVANVVRGLPDVASIESDANRLIVFPANGSALMPSLTRLADEHRWPVGEMIQQRGRLDEVFHDVTGGAQE